MRCLQHGTISLQLHGVSIPRTIMLLLCISALSTLGSGNYDKKELTGGKLYVKAVTSYGPEYFVVVSESSDTAMNYDRRRSRGWENADERNRILFEGSKVALVRYKKTLGESIHRVVICKTLGISYDYPLAFIHQRVIRCDRPFFTFSPGIAKGRSKHYYYDYPRITFMELDTDDMAFLYASGTVPPKETLVSGPFANLEQHSSNSKNNITVASGVVEGGLVVKNTLHIRFEVTLKGENIARRDDVEVGFAEGESEPKLLKHWMGSDDDGSSPHIVIKQIENNLSSYQGILLVWKSLQPTSLRPFVPVLLRRSSFFPKEAPEFSQIQVVEGSDWHSDNKKTTYYIHNEIKNEFGNVVETMEMRLGETVDKLLVENAYLDKYLGVKNSVKQTAVTPKGALPPPQPLYSVLGSFAKLSNQPVLELGEMLVLKVKSAAGPLTRVIIGLHTLTAVEPRVRAVVSKRTAKELGSVLENDWEIPHDKTGALVTWDLKGTHLETVVFWGQAFQKEGDIWHGQKEREIDGGYMVLAKTPS